MEAQTTRQSVLLATLVAVGLLWRPIQVMNESLWGPADPWTNGDFLGVHWLFWASTQPGNPTALLNYPWGEASILANFPNPFDAWLLGPLVAQMSFPLWFNLMMLGHHLLNVAATVWFARALDARPLHAIAAGALVAATPVMLHEHTLGHTLTAAVWPGLLGLTALHRGREWVAGFWIAIQGYCYLYTGLAFGLIAVTLRPRRGLALAVALMLPYVLVLAPYLEAANAVAPPDGFTALPIDGLLWQAQQPQVRMHPVLLLGLLAPWGGSRNNQRTRTCLAISAALLLLIALGPTWILERGQDPIAQSPIQALFQIPGISRMHHPIRMTMLAVPILAVSVAIFLHRRRAIWPFFIIGLVIPTWKTIDNTVAWPETATPPGQEAAEWLADNATGVVDLGSRSMEALALQTIHQKPILAGFHPRHHPRSGIDDSVFLAVEKWATGQTMPTLPATLKRLGYSHVIVIDRGRPLNSEAVREQLGPEVAPDVYAL